MGVVAPGEKKIEIWGMVQSKKQDNENNLRDLDYLEYKISFTFLISHYLNRVYENVSCVTFISYRQKCRIVISFYRVLMMAHDV